MEWHLGKIPKIAHFFWDNKPLSFLRWMSMHSFSVLNPDWEIKFHISPEDIVANWSKSSNNKHRFENGDYRAWLSKIDRLEIIEETDFSGLHGVHQSDILRNRFLSEQGGLWSDVDILYYRPMAKLCCNTAENANIDTGICMPNNRWLPIAFMLGGIGSKYFENVYRHQLAVFRSSKHHHDYQAFGTRIYQYILNQDTYSHFKIEKDSVYQQQWQHHARIFAGKFRTDIGVGLHWYGGSGSAANIEPNMTHENWRDFPLSRAIKITL